MTAPTATLDADLAWIAEEGFNTVRVPMGYRGLTSMTDEGTPSELVWNELAFARIDHLLDVCEEVGLRAVLDIQEAPGGQNEYAGPSTLYTDPAMQALAVDLWTELSHRYRDRVSVAAYSLLALQTYRRPGRGRALGCADGVGASRAAGGGARPARSLPRRPGHVGPQVRGLRRAGGRPE